MTWPKMIALCRDFASTFFPFFYDDKHSHKQVPDLGIEIKEIKFNLPSIGGSYPYEYISLRLPMNIFSLPLR